MPTDPAARSCGAPHNLHLRGPYALFILLLSIAVPAVSLARTGQVPNPQREVRPAPRPGGEQGQARHPAQGGFFQRLRELPPDQQRRVMDNSPQFQRLPPQRQEMIRERLRAWNEMSPQQKERVRQREEIFQALSPAQRQEARRLFPQYRDLTPARRQAVLVAFRHLRDLPPEQRQSYLQSQYVREQFSPHERNILQGLNQLLPTGRPNAPEDSEP